MSDTLKFGISHLPASSPPRNGHADLKRVERTIIDLRTELDDFHQMQKRGNKISLEVQGEVVKLEKDMLSRFRKIEDQIYTGFKNLRGQNDQILRLLMKKPRGG